MRVLAFVLFLCLAGAVRADVRPGEWEIEATVAVTGMAGGVPPVRQKTCLSAQDAANPGQLFGQGASCAYSDRKDDGSAFSFSVRCTAPVPMSGRGTVRYAAQSIEGTMDLRIDAAGTAIEQKVRMKGRWLGPCSPPKR